MKTRLTTAGLFLTALLGCEEVVPDLGAMSEPEIMLEAQPGPPGARPGSCWGKSIRPAVIETVTQQILVQTAELRADGSVLTPAIYRSEKQPRIVKAREETWFETPCPEDMTPEFVSSLQRALNARGYYRGFITGEMDNRTRAAIRRYQSEQGLNSGILSLETGRALGLVNVVRPTNLKGAR